jgi:hypothetical protein
MAARLTDSSVETLGRNQNDRKLVVTVGTREATADCSKLQRLCELALALQLLIFTIW